MAIADPTTATMIGVPTEKWMQDQREFGCNERSSYDREKRFNVFAVPSQRIGDRAERQCADA
ncbi:hypothetical protein [Bradyrhizobium canariense]|uniref:hypothetical protein n=1 Tax=Bradyrhizobium canariense TaxID=255045 RepID=UPI001CA47131|nr:hypothetical protein [Bradyrhizobium canariense]